MSRGSLLCVQTIFLNGCCHGHSWSSSHCHACRLASVSTERIMLCRWGCQLWTRMCAPGTSSSWPMCVKRGGGRTGGGRQQDICASLVYQWNHNYTSTKRRANVVDVRDGTKPSCVVPTLICGVAISTCALVFILRTSTTQYSCILNRSVYNIPSMLFAHWEVS